MGDVAILDMDIRSAERSRHGMPIDCYALDSTDLSGFRVLVVPAIADQEQLARHRERMTVGARGHARRYRNTAGRPSVVVCSASGRVYDCYPRVSGAGL